MPHPGTNSDPTVPNPLRAYLVIWVWCAALCLLTHLPMLFKLHREGDELVYLALAERMGWDFSGYTTKDDPRVNSFPYSIYRQDLFHHPPLYPWLLKWGLAWSDNPLLEVPGVRTPEVNRGELSPVVPGRVVAFAFLLAVGSTLAGTYYAARLMRMLGVSPVLGGTALVAITLCPLLLFSTVRIHHDALAGLFLFCGFVAFLEALTENRLASAIAAAVWLVAGFNLRFNSILMLPVVAALPCYLRRGTGTAGGSSEPASPSRGAWVIPSIVLGSVALLGLQHFYRLLGTYGSINPSTIIRPLPEAAQFSPFLTFVETKITRGWILGELALIFPAALLFLTPSVARSVWSAVRGRSAAGAMMLAASFLFLASLAISYRQLRYFALPMVFVHACWPWVLQHSLRGWMRGVALGLAGVTVFLMVTTGFLNATMAEPEQMMLIPSAAMFWPPLQRAYEL